MNGAPAATRTRDPLLRRQMLYPTELRAHWICQVLPAQSLATYFARFDIHGKLVWHCLKTDNSAYQRLVSVANTKVITRSFSTKPSTSASLPPVNRTRTNCARTTGSRQVAPKPAWSFTASSARIPKVFSSTARRSNGAVAACFWPGLVHPPANARQRPGCVRPSPPKWNPSSLAQRAICNRLQRNYSL